MPREDAIVLSVLRFLNGFDNTYARKVPTTRYSAGQPDIDGCMGGRALKFEVKQTGKKATPKQQAVLDRWQFAGAVTGVVHSKEEVHEILLREKLI